MTKRPPFSLYAHVPFCARKCPYCDFNTYATPRLPEAEYVEALSKELRRFGADSRFQGREIATVFFGGGTPSLLSAEAVASILRVAAEQFPIITGAEITLEANPGDVTYEKLRDFADAGINRISYGAQSFDNSRLKLLGREHTARQAIEAVSMARKASISNISVDIIFGTPDQTLADLERDVDTAAALPITHLSTYSLTIEPGTPFFQRQERGLLVMPEDSLVVEMLERLPDIMSERGFTRYEISNYAREQKESAHNNVYWMGGDYLGIGAGAHSYVAGWRDGALAWGDRWSAVALPQTYIRDAGSSRVVSWSEKIAGESLWFEFFYVGLRRMSGVTADEFKKRFVASMWDTYGDVLRSLERDGFLLIEGDRVYLSKRGVVVADSVFERIAR
jgi:oxygen-independent coproporphyrinogen-3 oxidase